MQIRLFVNRNKSLKKCKWKLTAVATTDKDLQYICDYTGLDEKTVKILNTLKENDKYINSVMLYIKQLKNIWR